jgi:hypothetical protein
MGDGLGRAADDVGGAHSSFGLDRTIGFLVADVRGLLIGRVEAAMYDASKQKVDAVSVRVGLLRSRRRLIPAGAIAAIDDRSKVIGLRIERGAIKAFL